MKTLLNFRNIFVAIVLSLLVCHNSSATNTDTTPNNCTTCTKKQQPYSFKHKMKTKVPIQVLNSEAAYQNFVKRKGKLIDLSYYVGVSSPFKSSMDTSGVWETLPNGDRVWRMQLHANSDWVKGIGVQTTEFILPEGCSLFFYSPDKKQLVGPVLPADPLGTRQRIVNTIAGKDICIEYYEPKAQKGKTLFNIDYLQYRLNDLPYSTTHRLKKTVPFVMPFSKERNESFIKDLIGVPLKSLSSGEQPTNYTLDNSGVWESLPNGDRIWRLGIRCELGYGIKLKTIIEIPKGGYFAYYSPDGYYVSSRYIDCLDHYDNSLYTGDMPGKEVIVEYYEPKNAKDKGSIKIARVEIDLTKWHTSSATREEADDDPSELACSPNVACGCEEFNLTSIPPFCSSSLTDLPNTLKKSVVRIRLFHPCAAPATDSHCLEEPSGTGVKVYTPTVPLLPKFCTGTLLNNSDCKPYIITASHCLKRFSNIDLTLPYNIEQDQTENVYFRFDFNFEGDCNQTILPSEQATFILESGAKLIASSVRLALTGTEPDPTDNGTGVADFALLEINRNIDASFEAMFAGWNAEQILPDKGVSVSHPMGFDKRFALQDDVISLVTAAQSDYNGIRPFRTGSPDYISNISLSDNSNNEHGSFFGLTFDRGSILGGSSGSGYFNPTGQLIGVLSGGPGKCESLLPNPSYPNGNNNMLSHYGRFWYSYDHVPTTGSNWSTQTAKQIEDLTSDGGASITAYEKRHSLKTWLGSSTNSMGAVEVQNCEIYLKDNPWDNPNNEPNQTALIDNSWYDIWESPDLWNTTVPFNTDIDVDNYETLLGPDNEEPDLTDNNSGELLDNYIRYNVRTPYTNECTTQAASLHLYWTIASTGEMWPDHWINHRVDNDCLVGQEITIHSNGDPYPITIDPLGNNTLWEGYIPWSPPNFTDPTAEPIYPYTDIANCPSINADADNNDKVEICLLARLQSLDNPIFGIETTNTTQNVLNSNNIVTRNTFLADPGIVGMAPDGGPSDNIISYGHPSIILIANNNDYVKNLDITLDKISEGSTEAIEQLMYIDLIPGDELWQKWESTGFKGEGIQIVAEKVIRVTNLETAKLLDIPFDAKEFEPLKIKVTIISSTGKRPSVANLPNEYKFRVSHRASRPAEQGNINPPTDCLFTVKDIAKYGSTTLPTEISLNVYPNPFKDQLNIVFTLPTQSPVSLNLYDIQGRLVKNINSNTNLPAGLNTYQIDTNDLPKGMYICHLIANKTAVAKKVVK